MRIVVAGGTGWLGSALVPLLAADGHQVVVLTRSVRPPAPNVRFAAWDGRTLTAWMSEVNGADAVINLAGESVAARRWTELRKRVLVASRIDPTRALVKAITEAANPPSVLVNASAVGYYGDRGDTLLTESDAPGEDFLARLVVEWEATAKTAPVRSVQLRIGVVIGPESEAVTRMALPYRFFVGGPIGSGRQWLPWVHRDDVMGMIRFVLNHADVEGPVNVTAPEPVRNREFARTLGQVLHRPAWLPVPAIALRLMFGELAGALLGSARVLPNRAMELGYTFSQPSLAPALAASLKGSR